jgi:hypothetical protein
MAITARRQRIAAAIRLFLHSVDRDTDAAAGVGRSRIVDIVCSAGGAAGESEKNKRSGQKGFQRH